MARTSGDDAFKAVLGEEMPGPTSVTLIQRAQQGDAVSRERLCRLYGRLVWRIYLARVPEQDRFDVWQEVFKTVFARLDEFEHAGHGGPAFRAWLHQIAYYKIGKYLEHRRQSALSMSPFDLDAVVPAEPGPEPPQDNRDELTEQVALVQGAFEEIAKEFEPRTIEAMRRVVMEEEPPQSVARGLGISVNAVYVARSRVLKRVRRLLEELGEPVGKAQETGPLDSEVEPP
jgi:RNA polymerase sigma-70 factor (ECF subfamily)